MDVQFVLILHVDYGNRYHNIENYAHVKFLVLRTGRDKNDHQLIPNEVQNLKLPVGGHFHSEKYGDKMGIPDQVRGRFVWIWSFGIYDVLMQLHV